jgi:hypothetical protein
VARSVFEIEKKAKMRLTCISPVFQDQAAPFFPFLSLSFDTPSMHGPSDLYDQNGDGESQSNPLIGDHGAAADYYSDQNRDELPSRRQLRFLIQRRLSPC